MVDVENVFLIISFVCFGMFLKRVVWRDGKKHKQLPLETITSLLALISCHPLLYPALKCKKAIKNYFSMTSCRYFRARPGKFPHLKLLLTHLKEAHRCFTNQSASFHQNLNNKNNNFCELASAKNAVYFSFICWRFRFAHLILSLSVESLLCFYRFKFLNYRPPRKYQLECVRATPDNYHVLFAMMIEIFTANVFLCWYGQSRDVWPDVCCKFKKRCFEWSFEWISKRRMFL